MSNKQHTPGPWYADKIKDRNAYKIFPHGSIHALLTVAGPVHDGAHPYALAAEANARLIAAAPEILQSLIEISNYFDVDGYCPDEVSQRYHAAIAKATGGQP